MSPIRLFWCCFFFVTALRFITISNQSTKQDRNRIVSHYYYQIQQIFFSILSGIIIIMRKFIFCFGLLFMTIVVMWMNECTNNQSITGLIGFLQNEKVIWKLIADCWLLFSHDDIGIQIGIENKMSTKFSNK